jgi:hypothetical protein
MYGFSNYLFYTINPCWSTGLRFELFRDNGMLAGIYGPPGGDGSQAPADYYSLTGAVNWKVRGSNLTIIPEIRYDWVNGNMPFAYGTKSQQFFGGIAATYTF